MRTIPLALGLLAATGCARAVPSSGERGGATQAVTRAAALDTSQARRLCANADSVITAGRACEVRDQGVRSSRFP
jgi:hypothetical protein